MGVAPDHKKSVGRLHQSGIRIFAAVEMTVPQHPSNILTPMNGNFESKEFVGVVRQPSSHWTGISRHDILRLALCSGGEGPD